MANEGQGIYKLLGKDKLLLSVGEQKVLCLFRREGDKLVFSVAKEIGMNISRQDVLGVLDPLNIEKNESSAASAMRTLWGAEETFPVGGRCPTRKTNALGSWPRVGRPERGIQ